MAEGTYGTMELRDGAITVGTVLTRDPIWSGLISVTYDDGFEHAKHISLLTCEARSLTAMLTQVIERIEEMDEEQEDSA